MFRRLSSILSAAIIAAGFSAHASDTAYRIVSEIKNGAAVRRERKITRQIANPASRIGWDELARGIWFPNSCEPGEVYIVVSDETMPEVSVLGTVTEAEHVELYGAKILRCSFSLAGRWDQRNILDTEEAVSGALDIRSLTIEGNGYVAIDATDKKPVAGRLRIERKALPALWQEDAIERVLTGEIETAWSEVP